MPPARRNRRFSTACSWETGRGFYPNGGASVTNPEKIRDLILNRQGGHRESGGLGDPEEQAPTAPAVFASPNSSDSGDLVDAACVLATEAKALRAALTEPRPPATGNSETSATPA